MRINHNLNSMFTQGHLRSNNQGVGRSLERLSTGMRINRASDDAAGLSVSEQLRTQVKGNHQAKRNAEDAIALINIAEGAMNETHSILQRGRELAIQGSSDTLTETDRSFLQQEASGLMDELTRIHDSTQYNGKQVLGGVDSELADSITEGLKSSWLKAGLALAQSAYGLGGNNENMKIIIENNGAGGSAAYVQGSYSSSTGDLVSGSLELHVDAADFEPGYNKTGSAAEQSGGSSPMYADRIIAHELVHATMAANIDGFNNLPTWFLEGAAEYAHGATERVATDTAAAGSTANLISSNTLSGGWAGDSAHYSTAYLAAVALDTDGGDSGQGSHFADIITSLAAGNDLDTAIAANTNYTGTADFEAAFDGGDGQIAATTVAGFSGTGAITNPAASATGIVADLAEAETDDPLSSFVEEWEDTQGPLIMHIGANDVEDTDTLEVTLSGVSAAGLGVDDVDLSGRTGAFAAVGAFDDAIEQVNEKRATAGSYVNRLEHTINNLENAEFNQQDAESRIRDVDFAAESTQFTRMQILQQSATSMLAQANRAPNSVMSLIG